MTDVVLIAILIGFFALAIGLVKVLGRMIDRDSDLADSDLDLDSDSDSDSDSDEDDDE
jgi:hypothetical protein